MSMVLRTNINSMNVNRNLSKNNTQAGKAIEKLTTGYALNKAADDASGLAVSEKMRAQISGLEQGTSNSLEGVGLVQTAEGAMEEIHNMLNRMVELATTSANGTLQDDVDREAIQAEIDVLGSEITRIALSTEFNGITLMDGTLSEYHFMDLGLPISNFTLTYSGFDNQPINFPAVNVNVNTVEMEELEGGRLVIDGGDVIMNFQPNSSKPEGYTNEVAFNAPGEYTIYIDTSVEVNADAFPYFTVHKEDGTHYIFSGNDDEYQESSGYIAFANDGSSPPDLEYQRVYDDGLTLQVADENAEYNRVVIYIDIMTGEALNVNPLAVNEQETAGLAINIIKDAINYVSGNRSNMGGYQNRLEHTIKNNMNMTENVTESRSVIKDADMAKEMVEYTKMDVITQSAQTLLANANQTPQQVLSLLG